MLSLLFIALQATAFLPANPGEVLQQICQKPLGNQPYRYEQIFTDEFRAALPEREFRRTMTDVIRSAGLCVEAQLTKSDSSRTEHGDMKDYKATLKTNRGNLVYIEFAFDSDGFVGELLIENIEFPGVVIRTWADVNAQISRLPGLTSMQAGFFGRPGIAIRNLEQQPIASTFKLYVLRALEDEILTGQRRWTDRFPILNQYKSLPSGIMQTWPQGRSVSLGEFADHMIRISDNTATDHLIAILGRQRIEQTFKATQHSKPEINSPLLMTADLFKLKWGVPLDFSRKYLAAEPNQKREILDQQVSTYPITSVGRNGLPMDRPTAIRQIEWFASSADLCRVMESFVKTQHAPTWKILSQNTPGIQVGTPESSWIYAGYKGGSEPGVISMTYLLRDKRGRMGCLSASWSNEGPQGVSEFVFKDLIAKSLKLLAFTP